MRDMPCKTCLVFTLCKARLHSDDYKKSERIRGGISALATRERCKPLAEYLGNLDRDIEDFNRARNLFGLESGRVMNNFMMIELKHNSEEW
jgi:hypothetical protein